MTNCAPATARSRSLEGVTRIGEPAASSMRRATPAMNASRSALGSKSETSSTSRPARWQRSEQLDRVAAAGADEGELQRLRSPSSQGGEGSHQRDFGRGSGAAPGHRGGSSWTASAYRERSTRCLSRWPASTTVDCSCGRAHLVSAWPAQTLGSYPASTSSRHRPSPCSASSCATSSRASSSGRARRRWRSRRWPGSGSGRPSAGPQQEGGGADTRI